MPPSGSGAAVVADQLGLAARPSAPSSLLGQHASKAVQKAMRAARVADDEERQSLLPRTEARGGSEVEPETGIPSKDEIADVVEEAASTSQV